MYMREDPREGLGTILFISELRQRLEQLNINGHRWKVSLSSVGFAEPIEWAEISFNNPTGGLPNDVRYRFPVIEIGGDLFADQLVCLHPSLAEPLCHGLYFEGEELTENSMYDFERFWPQLKNVI